MKKERSASVKTLIKEAELTSAPSDFVYRFYFEQSKAPESQQTDDVDEYTEQQLLDKQDAFIDLTLAQYCFYPETLETLFKNSKAEKNVPLTLACLSNTTVGRRKYSFTKIPEALFTSFKKEALDVWLKSITKEELDALFRNPTTEDGFLTEVLEGKKLWSQTTDEQKRTVLAALADNPRVSTPYDNSFIDGWAEHSHGRLAAAIWQLAATLPVERQWGAFVGRLLEKVVGGSHSMDMLEVAKRWNFVDPKEEPEKKKQYLNPFESVRYQLYKGSGKLSEPHGKDRVEARKQIFGHVDLAYRAAVYSQFDMTPDEIVGAYEKDALVAFQYISENLYVWRNPASRKALKDIGWDADGKYNNNYLDCANQFNWKEKDLEAKHPAWFVDKDEGPSEEEAPQSELEILRQDQNDSHAKLFSNLQEIYQLLTSVHKQVRPIALMLGILVALFAYEIYSKH